MTRRKKSGRRCTTCTAKPPGCLPAAEVTVQMKWKWSMCWNHRSTFTRLKYEEWNLEVLGTLSNVLQLWGLTDGLQSAAVVWLWHPKFLLRLYCFMPLHSSSLVPSDLWRWFQHPAQSSLKKDHCVPSMNILKYTAAYKNSTATFSFFFNYFFLVPLPETAGFWTPRQLSATRWRSLPSDGVSPLAHELASWEFNGFMFGI